jgi:hypothetical protein
MTARPEHFQAARPQVSSGGSTQEPRKSILPWLFAIVLVLGASGVLIAWMMTRGSSDNANGRAANTNGRDDVARSSSPAESTEPTVAATPSGGIGSGSGTPPYQPSATPRATTEARPSPNPTPERPKPIFNVLNNTTYGGGSRITYYPRASFALCEADCARNGNCKALTWIRPGAYNPGDAAMCYLMYSVTGPVTHECCISAVRN